MSEIWILIEESYESDFKTQRDSSVTGGGGDLQLDNINIAVSQAVSVSSYSWTDPNS